MLPTTKQWKKWSLPSKYTAVGLLVALISLAFPLCEYLFNQINENQSNAYNEEEFLEDRFTDELQPSTSTSEALNKYNGDGNVKYDHLYLAHFHELKILLYKINSTRMEYPKRAIDIAILQDKLDSGDMRIAKFIANEIIEKQRNIALINK